MDDGGRTRGEQAEVLQARGDVNLSVCLASEAQAA